MTALNNTTPYREDVTGIKDIDNAYQLIDNFKRDLSLNELAVIGLPEFEIRSYAGEGYFIFVKDQRGGTIGWLTWPKWVSAGDPTVRH